MCLAFPARVVEKNDTQGTVELAGNRYTVNFILVPEVQLGQYVLVHAGYAIRVVDEADAKETWELLSQIGNGHD